MEHGYISTEELKDKYGYDHPPRAARDVREEGIPLETFKVLGSNGRKIAAYRFADPASMRKDKLGGRKTFPKQFKQSLVDAEGSFCAICLVQYEERYLQVDHRIPYEVADDTKQSGRQLKDYMLICPSCNRSKSWSCEHCDNWREEGLIAVCQSCYWAHPDSYTHIAQQQMRRTEIVWVEDELLQYELIRERAVASNESIATYIKRLFTRLYEEQDE